MHLTTTRRSNLMSNPRLQPILRRKTRERQRATASCVVNLGIRPRIVLIARTRSLQTWSLATKGKHRVREMFLLADGELFACSCSWCWYSRSEVYFGKDRVVEERAACPLNKEESCVLNAMRVFKRNNFASLTRHQKRENLTRIELVHSDLCEINSVLTKGEERSTS